MVDFVASIFNDYNFRHNKQEICFVGRSNVGKSSLINMLADAKIARISSMPGKTQSINIYNFENKIYLIDLPGYGYAKRSKAQMLSWSKLIESYFLNNSAIKLCIHLLDIRHDPTEKDIEMLNLLYNYQISFQIILTKCDKIKKHEIENRIKSIANCLRIGKDNIIITSSITKENKNKIKSLICS